jgi:hypothetical protein
LKHDADRLRDEIHVVAHDVDGGGRNFAQRAIFVDLSIDLANELGNGGDGIGLQLLGADVGGHGSAGISRRHAGRKLL